MVPEIDRERNFTNFLRSEQSSLPRIVYTLIHIAISIFSFFLRCADYFLLLDYRQNRRMNSLLDLVREKIKDLKDYRDTDAPSKPHVLLNKDVDYLSEFEEGSYKWYVAKVQVDAARRVDERNMQSYEKQLKEFNDRQGVEEKKDAVEALCNEFVSLEKTLLEKDAKTFAELHPDKIGIESFPGINPYHGYDSSPPSPFEVKFEFKASAMTDENREAHLKL